MKCLRKGSSFFTIKRIKHCVCSPCHDAKPSVLPSEHPATEEPVGSGLNPDEISNEPIVSGGRKKRSISDFFYDLFTGDEN